MSSIQQRKNEILAKRAKLVELKRQRELRQQGFTHSRASTAEASEVTSPIPSRSESRAELDDLISRLVDRPGSTPTGHGADLTSRRGSRPNSILSTSQVSGDNTETFGPSSRPLCQSIAVQTSVTDLIVSTAEISPVPEPKQEIVTYSKGVQTDGLKQISPSSESPFDSSDEDTGAERPNSYLSKGERERERDESIRSRLRQEIEDEIQATKKLADQDAKNRIAQSRYPLRTLDEDELRAVTSSNDFLDFVDRSIKVIERTLDEEYDVLTDYELTGADGGVEDYGEYGKKRKGIKEVCQFWDERWNKKRMISDICFSPKFPELVLASYTKNLSAPHEPDGLVQVWNQHLHSRPEYVFHSTSDILTAKFSPFHPNYIIGGSYSGQVLLWDTRSSRAGGGAPVQKTPLSGAGHTHPVYNISIVGTQNAHNILTASTDGVVCGWTIDMLSHPQEYLELTTPPPSKTEDLAPTTMSFPQSDQTFFIVGTEEGGIYPCHRYNRAGAKAGVDHRLSYRGHAAAVMSTAFHPARGPVDLGDLMLSSSLDWSVRLWRVRPPATSVSAASTITTTQTIAPILDINREDVVYDAKWSPHRPGVFSLVDGAGNVEVWDLYTDTEVPVVRTTPSKGRSGILTKSLNKLAWEEREGRRIATGGLDGVLSIFEVGKGLGGTPDEVPKEEWAGMKRLVGKLEQKDRVG